MGVIKRPGATLGVLTAVNVLNYVDRYVGAPLLPLMIPALGITYGQAGLLQGIFIVVYSLTSPIIGWLGDKRPRLRMAAFGVALWSAATFASGLAQTFALLLLARAVVGIGEASYAIVAPSLLSDLYTAERRGRVMAVFYAAIPVGSALAYVVGGLIGEAYGWRAAFLVVGGPGVLLALTLLLLEEPARGKHDVRPAAAVALSLRASLAALRARPSYLYNTAAQTIYTFTMGGLATWMPTYFVNERHLSKGRAGWLFGVVLVVAGFIGTIFGGQIGDRLARRYPGAHFTFSGCALIASLPFTLLAILSPHPAIFWSGMFVTLLLLFLNTGPLNAAMANVLPPDLRGRGFALYSVAIHLLGDAISPPLIGVAADHMPLRIPVLASGMLLVVAGVVLLAGRRALVSDLGAATS
jgi:MFS transporter, Spinster family, sphingosine-1-phosphate transporter